MPRSPAQKMVASWAVVALLAAGCHGSPKAHAPAEVAAASAGPFTPAGGKLAAVDGRTGRLLWTTQLPMASTSLPAVVGTSVVVVGYSDCDSYALSVAAVDSGTGRPVWYRDVDSTPCDYDPPTLRTSGSLVVAGGPLEQSSGDGCTPPPVIDQELTSPRGFDAATGAALWKSPPGTGDILAASADNVLVRGPGYSCLVSLDARTGARQWYRAMPVVDVAVGPSGTFVFSQDDVGSRSTLSGLDRATGAERWQAVWPRDESPRALYLTDHAIIASTSFSPQNVPGDPAGQAHVDASGTEGFDPATGHLLWSSKEEAAAATGDVALLQGSSGLDLRDARTGKRRWASATTPTDTSGNPFVIGGSLVVVVEDKEVVALDTATGHVRWQLAGAWTGAAIGSGNVFLTQGVTPKNPLRGG